MALQLKDRIYTNCSTIGKADIEIGATKEGYQGWEAITDGSTVYYCITDDTAWEVGYGVKTGTEIVRNLLSSNTGSLLSLNGNSSVFCTYPAEKAVFLNLDGNIHFPSANVTANTFVGKGSGITNINAETNNLTPEAPNDGETYARNNKTWVSISDSAGIPDAPVDNLQYGRQNGEWTEVESGTNGYTKAEIDAQQNAQDVNITANTNAIANLPSPVDTYTKAEINASQDAQDVEIAKKANTSDTYTKTATDTLLDSKANVGDSYTKAETYTSVEVDSKLFEKADKTTTYTKTEIDNSQDAQDTNISNNTSAIGTLSGRVSANEQDIATLQDGIFFSSSYTTDYPSNPNRDPEKGNIYLQDLSAFTYSYADANQVFISKTDEQGNVRQFTAVKPDDILVLNQVESPNYGRYKVSSVNDVGDYVNVIVEFQVGEGTVLEGDTLALQAFPASEGGTGGGIPEAPIDGKQYGRQDATWTEVTGGGDTQPSKLYTATLSADTPLPNAVQTKVNYTGENWADGVFTATEKGVYDITVGFQWSLVNPIDNQIYRNCYIYINGIIAVENSHGVDVSYPYGSCNQTQWLADLNVGDKVEIRANQANVNSEEQGLLVSSPNQFVNIALLGSGTGGGEAQPPVAFNTLLTSAQTISPATKTTILYDDVKLDTDSNYNSTTGKYTISSDGIYRIGASVNLKKNNVLIDALAYLNINSEAPQRNRFDYDASTGTSSSFMAVNIDYVADLKQGDEVSISAYGRTTDDSDLELIGGIDAGNVFNIIKVSGGASSGGGTAEPMVWENKTAERAYDTVYTNTKDCPIYVQPYLERNSTDRMYVQFKIDGDLVWTEGGEAVSFSSPMFVVPSGSTYELVNTVTGTALKEWFEANVSGGASSGGGSYTPESLVWEDKKLENDFDVLYTNDSDVPRYVEISLTCLEDTEYAYANFLIDGKYHASMGKRGSGIRDMSQGMFIVPAGSTYNLEKDGSVVIGTWWEARMPVAVGTGGDSIWSDVDGDAVLETDGKKLTIDANVGELGLKSRITTDASILEFNVGSGSLPEMTIGNNGNVGVGGNPADFGGTNLHVKSDDVASVLAEGNGRVTQILANESAGCVIGARSNHDLKIITNDQTRMTIATDGKVTTQQDMVVNGMTVGASSSQKNTFIGKNALASRTNGMFCVAVGEDALKNSAEGGAYNTAIGYNAGGNLTTGSGNICIGYQAQASSPTVTNEVTIGSDDVTSTRLKGQVTVNDNLTIKTGELLVPDMSTTVQSPNVYIDGKGQFYKSTTAFYSTEEVDKKLAIKDKLIEKLSARLDELEKKVK